MVSPSEPASARSTTAGRSVADLDLRPEPFDSPAAQVLIAAVQAEYVERYGGIDETAIDAAEFVAPHGGFLVGYVDDSPVACGGWRRIESPPGTAELKRMYVVTEHRRRGFARLVLLALEDAVRAAGCTRIWLETGLHQPEAIALYSASGYVSIPGYGYYADAPLARPMGKELAT
jgi:GNAT superfamily N-acetyltransferase